MKTYIILAGALALMTHTSVHAQQPVRVYAADSLSTVMTTIGAALEREYGVTLTVTTAGSGTLRERIEHGEPADLFASANMDHPLALTKKGLSGPTMLFLRTSICAYSRPDVKVTTETLLDRMLDPAVKLGTSTPGADPGGDYAWQVFGRAESIRPGAYAKLDAKALKLMGGSPGTSAITVPAGRQPTAFFLETRAADIFLFYCAGARAISQELSTAVVVPLPGNMTVGANFGMTVMKNAPIASGIIAAYLLSPDGQRTLANAGFTTVTMPADESH